MSYLIIIAVISLLAIIFYFLAKNVKQSQGKMKEFLIGTAICLPGLILCKGWLLFASVIGTCLMYIYLYLNWRIGRPEDIMRDD